MVIVERINPDEGSKEVIKFPDATTFESNNGELTVSSPEIFRTAIFAKGEWIAASRAEEE